MAKDLSDCQLARVAYAGRWNSQQPALTTLPPCDSVPPEHTDEQVAHSPSGRKAMESISIRSGTRNEFIDITAAIQEVVSRSSIQEGCCLLFVPHTTAAITINEGADPSVQQDLLSHLSSAVPQRSSYQHQEGNSDAHIKATLVGASEKVMVQNGRLVLGTWQAIFFCEFDGPRSRKLHVMMLGDTPPAKTP